MCLCTSDGLTGSTSCETGGGFLKVFHGSYFGSFIRECLFRFRWSLLNLRVLFFPQSVCAVYTHSITEVSSPRGGSSCTLSEVTIMATQYLWFGVLVGSKLMCPRLLDSLSSRPWPQIDIGLPSLKMLKLVKWLFAGVKEPGVKMHVRTQISLQYEFWPSKDVSFGRYCTWMFSPTPLFLWWPKL